MRAVSGWFCIFWVGMQALSHSRAGPGDQDLGFSEPPFGGGFPTTVSALAIQSDGKILAGGNFLHVWGAERSGVARLNTDGSLDTDFAGNNVPADVRALALQPDGKVLVGIGYPLGTKASVMRLNSDGTTDTNFTASYAPYSTFLRGTLGLFVQEDGRIVAGGGTLPDAVSYLLRIESTGKVDTAFLRIPNGVVETLIPGAAGRIFIGGRFTYPRTGVALLETNGLAASFSPDIGTNAAVHALALQPDGELLVGGKFIKHGAFTNFARLTASGAYAPFSFPIGFDGEVLSIGLDSVGRMVVAGDFAAFYGWQCAGLVRLKSTGELDTGFSPAAAAGIGHPIIAVQSDDCILVGGASKDGHSLVRVQGGESLVSAPIVAVHPAPLRVSIGESLTLKALVTHARWPYRGTWSFNGTNLQGEFASTLTLTNVSAESGGIYEFTATNLLGSGQGSTTVEVQVLSPSVGRLDPNYNTNTRPQVMDGIFALASQPNGGTIIGGGFSSFNGIGRTNLARVDSSGNVDASFNAARLAYGTYPNTVQSMAMQADGKLIVAGRFSRYLFRCDTAGALDSEFVSSYSTALSAVAVQSDGRVLIGGSTFVRRLTSAGVLDTSFNAVGTPNTVVQRIVVQPDRKILVGGSFTTWGGTSRPGLVRLHEGGEVDYSFDAKLTGPVSAIAFQDDGRIYVGGNFQGAGGAPRSGLARLNPDGSLDASFDIGTGFQAVGPQVLVRTLALQPDGKLLVGGGFTSAAGSLRNAIVRLNNDGRLDATFNTGSGPDGVIYAMALQPDGNVIIAGDFNNVNGERRDRLARLYGNNPPPLPVELGVPVVREGYVSVSFQSEPQRLFTLQTTESLTNPEWVDGPSIPGNGNTMTLTDTNALGVRRFFRLHVE